ncbi:GAF and ANTAR domain-containing protein [Oerskovia flava]|uniref:GAF and ANTAR domain-containing protein n=1 Tax=Oerskovia flava TaxID=2986422 RepID=UPI00223F8580|nr:GAF and ANTAR domain-containing protein [Oerskovia sp. JB1-3-2]
MVSEMETRVAELAEQGLDGEIAAAARLLADEPSLQETLDRIAQLAVAMVDGCDSAGISMVVRGGRIETPAHSDDVAVRGDELQYALDEGPCLDAIRETEVVYTADLALDERWPRWSHAVLGELGVRSMLCIQLYTTDAKHGALNLYAQQPNAFPADIIPLATTFAAVAAAALDAARTEDQLQTAVHTRTLIGQAQGIIMERYRVSPAQAFAVLSRVSQDSNVRLQEVARQIVTTRRVPGAAPQN